MLLKVANNMKTIHMQMVKRMYSSFLAEKLVITKTKSPQPKPDMEKLVFGHHFSDHMLTIEWKEASGWGKPHIHPMQNFSLHPAAKVLHYAQEVFEGLKAFAAADGSISLFRPQANMDRMQKSAQRACFPAFDKEELLKCMGKLVAVDRDWVPKSRGKSLYVRPTLIGIESSLGVAPSKDVLLYVIAGPVGPYFPTGVKPVSLLADPAFVRAWPGGCGAAKMGSNYAPTLYVQQQANKQNCQQVLWLMGSEEHISEAGTMNLFVFWTNEKNEKELITPPLDGTILPGVTRASLLDLARQWNAYKVSEAPITMTQFVKALKEGRVHEMFGAGTACLVCPVDHVLYKGENLPIPTMKDGAPVAMKFLKELNDIQYGSKGPHPWLYRVPDN